MGVGLRLTDPETGATLTVPPFIAGGTVQATYDEATDTLTPAPTEEAWVSITYNYGQVLKFAMPGYSKMRYWLEGRVASDLAPELRRLIDVCGTNPDRDYWAPTPGNVGAICALLLSWCELHPTGVFKGSW